jgi:AraC-like DNA-binding protein
MEPSLLDFRVSRFVSQCHIVGQLNGGTSLVSRLRSVWSCLASIPIPATSADQSAISVAVLSLAKSLESSSASSAVSHLPRKSAPVSECALTFLLRQYTDPSIRVTSLARSLGVSRSYVSRAVTKGTGCAFLTHLHGLRVLRGAFLLRSSTLSIKEVAAAVGYPRTSELDRQFGKRLHMSPSVFRTAATRQHKLRLTSETLNNWSTNGEPDDS